MIDGSNKALHATPDGAVSSVPQSVTGESHRPGVREFTSEVIRQEVF
jgi:hypothetical protein